MADKDWPLHHGNSPPCSTKSTRPRPFFIFFLISFPDLWLTSPLHVMTWNSWHMSDDVAVVWTSTALRANRYSCTLVWAEWGRARTRDGERTASGGSWTLKIAPSESPYPSAGSLSLRAIFHKRAKSVLRQSGH